MTQSSTQPTRQFRGKLARTTLLLLLPLTLLPVALLGGITLYNTADFLQEQIIIQFDNVASQQVEQINLRVDYAEEFLTELDNDTAFYLALDHLTEEEPGTPSWQEARRAAFDYYQQVALVQPTRVFNHLLIVSPDNTILAATNPLWEGDQLTAKIFRELLIKPDSILFYGTYQFSEDLANQVVMFSSQQVYDGFGNHVVTLIGLTGSAEFQRILELGTLSHPEARPYYITSSEVGEVFIGLAPSGGVTAFSPSLDHIGTVIPKVDGKEVGSVVEFESFNDTPVLGIVSWVESANAAVVLEVPQTVLTTPIRSSAVLQVSLIVIALVALGFIIWRGTRWIVNPILEMAATANNFASGDLSARSTVERSDEIGLLAFAFNSVADQLVSLYRSLESQVESRTEQIRTASEVAQIVTSAQSIDDMLSRTVNMIIDRFGYYHSAIYLLERGGEFAELKQAAGEAAEHYSQQGIRLAVGSRSIVGTVSQSNKSWVAPDVKNDPYFLDLEYLSETRSEIVVPMSIGTRVLGVLDVQSKIINGFDEADITILETLANQIASALQNVRLLENTQLDLQSAGLLFQSSHALAQADSAEDVFQALSDNLSGIPYEAAVFTYQENQLKWIRTTPNEVSTEIPIAEAEREQLRTYSASQLLTVQNYPGNLPFGLLDTARSLGSETFILLPLRAGEQFTGVILVGSQDAARMTPVLLEPYQSIAEMANTSLEKLTALEEITERFAELESLNTISQAISTKTELADLYAVLHKQILQAMGQVSFLVALYDSRTQLVEIPYMDDEGRIVQIPSFPLGQGLTSILIRTRQPLMIVEDTANRTRALGAIITSDRPAQSWLGVPMIIAGEVVGAIVVQDIEQEGRFDDDDMRLLTTLAAQVAPTIRNARLLTDAQLAAERDRHLFEITDTIRQANSIEEILETTTKELGQVLDLTRAKIEILIDQPDEEEIQA